MELGEVVEILMNTEPYGGTAQEQVERRARENEARRLAAEIVNRIPEEASFMGAPAWYGADEATAWACGFNKARDIVVGGS